MAARVKEGSKLSGSRVSAGNIWTFEGVAPEATQAQIAQFRLASMLLGIDMVNLKWGIVKVLRHLAVLTAVSSTIPNFRGKFRIHEGIKKWGVFWV
jgi:hypothetical protein